MKGKQILFLCLILVVWRGFFSYAANPEGNPGPGGTGSSVWEISKNGNTLYLGGSVHILREKDFPLPKEFDMAFERSSIVVLETDIDKMANPEILQYFLSQMILPPGKTLETILNPEAYSLLKEKCEAFGFSVENVSSFKPSMVLNILTVLEIQNSGFLQQGVDMYYLEKAKEAEKSLDFLESVETQIDIIVSMGEGYESDYVMYSLQDLENTTEAVVSIVSDWKNGVTAITELSIMEMKKNWPVIYKDLLRDRNNAWMLRLEEYLTTAPVEFVIVGLAHLHGPDGLLKQFEQSGCTVKQLAWNEK